MDLSLVERLSSFANVVIFSTNSVGTIKEGGSCEAHDDDSVAVILSSTSMYEREEMQECQYN